MELTTIIQNAYKIFNYPTPLEITNVCTACCISEEDARNLIALPLQNIPVELFHEYNDHAQALNYDMNEFKYFLPRNLELISQFQFTSGVDVSLSLKNLNYNNPEFWTKKEEIDCVQDFMFYFFNKCLKTNEFTHEGSLLDILNMIYCSGFDIKNLLEIWLINLNNFSIIHLEQLITDNFNYRGKMRTNGFIDSNVIDLIEKWITTNKNAILNAIEKHIMESSLKNEQLQKLSYLYDTMNFL